MTNHPNRLSSSPDLATKNFQLRKRLEWALERLDECGKQLEFTLGMCRSMRDCRDFLAKVD